MLKLMTVSDRAGDTYWVPTLYCDQCQQPITRKQPGYFLFQPDSEPYAVHRGHCERQFCASNGGRDKWLWLPIHSTLFNLAVNSHPIEKSKMKRLLALLDDGTFTSFVSSPVETALND